MKFAPMCCFRWHLKIISKIFTGVFLLSININIWTITVITILFKFEILQSKYPWSLSNASKQLPNLISTMPFILSSSFTTSSHNISYSSPKLSFKRIFFTVSAPLPPFLIFCSHHCASAIT